MEEEVPVAVLVVMGTSSLLSLATLFYLFQKHLDGRSLLAYEPRLSVPWGPVVGTMAVAMPLIGVLMFLVSADAIPVGEPAADAPIADEARAAQPPDEAEQDDAIADENKAEAPESSLASGWSTFAFMVLFVFAVAALIAAHFRANGDDFGLPTSLGQAARDVGVGVLATCAALVPTYLIQLTLINAIDSDTKHPLVEQLQADPSPAMLVLGFAMAVIAAPLFEEFTFRLLLQGWLEKLEDEVIGYEATRRATEEEQFAVEMEGGELSGFAEPTGTGEEGDGATVAFDDDVDANSSERPLRGLLPMLPHGWTPILISGTLFGLAHVGHGVAPVALVLFGIVLGYVYQRTHRLLPSIAAHMTFNAYSMLLLWLQLDPPAG